MRHINKFLLLWIATLGAAGISFAQDNETPKVIGGFDTQGSITAGYRFTDVAGRRQKFDELFSLRSGFVIHDITLTARAKSRKSFADSVFVTASGLGGDPLTSTQIRISRKRVYDLNLGYRESHFYWDRNDAADLPSGLHGMTNNHDWATVRRFGSASGNIQASHDLRLGFEYQRNDRTGGIITTRTLDYFGDSTAYGAFLRANPYIVEAPIDQLSNRYGGSVAYSKRDWSLYYRAGYQRYNEALNLHNPVTGERSINVDDPNTAKELLNVAQWHDTRKLSTPFSEFSYNGQIHPRVKVRGGYTYYRYTGPSHIDAAFSGIARTNSAGTAVAPFSASMTSEGTSKEPNHVIDEGFSVTIHDQVRVHADYRYSRFTMTNLARFASTDNAGSQTGQELAEWRDGTHTLDIAIELRPSGKWLLRPGIRLMKRDVALEHNGVTETEASKRSKVASPLLTVYYAPTKKVTIRGDMRNSTNSGPYTRVSPRTDFSARGVFRYTPTPKLAVENAIKFDEAAYTTTNFKNKVRSDATVVEYSVRKDLALTAGFTYDSFLATSAVQFLRGPAPLNATWRDQAINRVWELGIEARPAKMVELRLSGNYVRTTGVGEISGEPPTYGPLRWPMVTGTVAMDIPRAGKLWIDLQRTYYIEEIVTGNNFSANILGIRWTSSF